MSIINLNGSAQPAQAGERLIDVINRASIEVPQVCYHPQLGPIQSCDTCMVEVDGRLVRACGTIVADGMQVSTHSAAAAAAQRVAFDRILENHLLYCTVCDKNNGNCTVHNTTKMLAVEHQSIPFKTKPYEVDSTNPFYRYDPNQCILCGRCVEACQNVQVNETLSINWEDPHPRVLWDGGAAIGESSCVSCGHCITVCPCNALMEKSMLGHAGFFTAIPNHTLDGMIDVVKRIEPEAGYGSILKLSEVEAAMRTSRIRRTKTVCTYCGVGCSFDVWTKDRHILKIAPESGETNGISTCIKGKFGWDYVNSADRLTTPLIREGDTFRKASWDEALALVAERLSQIKRKAGPQALAFVSSSKCTNEENYLMQKFARAVIGTNNMDNCSRYCQAPATKGLSRTVGHGGDSGSIHDIAMADLIITIGSNTAESHPVLATRVKRAHKLHGQKLIVADIRKHEMAERADLFIQPRPGTDLIWISAIAKHIIDQGLHKKAFIDQWVNGFEAYYQSLAPFTLEAAEAATGLSIATLQQIAREIASADRLCILWAMGVTQHTMGTDTSTAISNLLLITGNYMRPGTGAYPLRGHNNVQGAGDMGAMPDKLPGYQAVDDPQIRAKFEAEWGVSLPSDEGFDNHQMIDAIGKGELRGLYLFGEEMALVDCNMNLVEAAFGQLEFLVVQDIFFSETCRFADVVLPASPSLEKEGTFTNTERRIQRLYQVFEPLEGSRPDWIILQDLANLLGAKWNYNHPSEIMDEIARVAPIMAGVNYDRLEGYRTLQWPVHADGTDEPLLYTKGFPFPDNKARLHPVHWSDPKEQPDDEYDLHLNNGRLLEHFHEGNMTGRVAGIHGITPNAFVELAPELARQRGIETGTRVKLQSAYGEIEVLALISDRVKGNELYMTNNSVEHAYNRLTGSNADPVTHTPAYKECRVRISIVEQMDEPPLPRRNFRFGRRTPQAGVEVERKWKRADYHSPAEQFVQLRVVGKTGVSQTNPAKTAVAETAVSTTRSANGSAHSL
jgi:formate dehydrogenase major subunit